MSFSEPGHRSREDGEPAVDDLVEYSFVGCGHVLTAMDVCEKVSKKFSGLIGGLTAHLLPTSSESVG